MYDCVADNPDELSFKQGDVIVISKERIAGENDTWMVFSAIFRTARVYPFILTHSSLVPTFQTSLTFMNLFSEQNEKSGSVVLFFNLL